MPRAKGWRDPNIWRTVDGVEQKKCPRCGEWKPFDLFIKNRRQGPTYCRPCNQAKVKEFYEDKPGLHAKRQRTYYYKYHEDNKAKQRARGKRLHRERGGESREDRAARMIAERIEREVTFGKKCVICGEVKPIEQFSISNRAKQVRAQYCKPCRSMYVIESRRRKKAGENRDAYGDLVGYVRTLVRLNRERERLDDSGEHMQGVGDRPR